MKKFLKILSITGAILVGLGALVMCIAAFIYKWNPNATPDKDLGTEYTFDDSIFGTADINHIEIRSSYGDIEVSEGDKWSLRMNNIYIPGVHVELDADRLDITANSPSDINILGWLIGVFNDFDLKGRSKIVLTVPSGTELDILYCDAGPGSVEANGINSRLILCQAPVGKLLLTDCSASERIAFDCIAGSIVTDNVYFGKLDLDMRFGIAEVDKHSAPAAGVNYNSKLIYRVN